VPNYENLILPALSLLIAALAVFFGPLISSSIARREREASLLIAKKNIIAPIRQAWINELRILLSKLTHNAAIYWSENDQNKRDEIHLNFREQRSLLALYLNPNEQNHIDLLDFVGEMEATIFGSDQEGEPQQFWHSHNRVIEQSQKILKLEWERVKNEI
jgi:hypothetical protein